ncbi:MAG: energy transducer TonB [Bacteroidota bacterium]|nr:energy transducer TonB [Bacteroidota bacterium]
MKKIILTILLLNSIVISVLAQDYSKLILGDWKEVRRESRLGYICNSRGDKLIPGISMKFYSDTYGHYHDTQSPELKRKAKYTFVGDSIIEFISYYEIVKLESEKMILIRRAYYDTQSMHDLKSTYIRKSVHNKLTADELKQWQATTNRDIVYRDSCKLVTQKDDGLKKNSDGYIFVEKMPQFPGGNSNINLFIEKNKKELISKEKVVVVTTFYVETDGRLTDIKVKKSISPEFDAEAIRIIRLMPAWSPAENDGKKIRLTMSWPILFN